MLFAIMNCKNYTYFFEPVNKLYQKTVQKALLPLFNQAGMQVSLIFNL
jgi:hypothetical protein